MSTSHETKPNSEQPNLLVIMTDQQSSWTLSCYGAQEIDTPNIDRLSAEGVRLTNFFANSACCTPSRGCFFTGLYPHQHGAHFNDLPLSRGVTSLAEMLRRQDYETSYIGKWHLDGDIRSLRGALKIVGMSLEDLGAAEEDIVDGARDRWIGPDRSMGFTDSRWMFNCSHAKRIDCGPEDGARLIPGEIGDEESFTTDWLTSRAIEVIEGPRSQPFFLTLSIPDPHDPFSVRAPFDTMFRPGDVMVPETFLQTDLPDWMRSESVNHWHRPERVVGSEQALRSSRSQYLGEVACIDYNVGRIISALERKGTLDNTVVVFTTDHGEYMGEHGIYAKNQLYETAYRIPFIVRHPSQIAAGSTLDRFVTTVDVQQTLLGLLGLSSSDAEEGRDASPLLRGDSREIDTGWVDEAFIYGTAMNRAGVFTPEYELAYVDGAVDHILFDRREDPLQIRNLFHEASHRRVVADLSERLLAHNKAIATPEVRWLENTVPR